MTDIEKLEELISNNNITCQKETIKSGDTLVFTTEGVFTSMQYERLMELLKGMVKRLKEKGIMDIDPLVLEGGLKLDTIIRKHNDKI